MRIVDYLRIAAAILLFAAAGCGGGGSSAGVSGPQVDLPAPTGQYQAIKFTLTTDKQVYTLGQPVNATLTATNTGSQAVGYALSSDPAGLLVQQGSTDVWDAIRHPTAMDGATGVSPTPLAPGQSISYPFVWNQVTDGGLSTAPGGALPQVPAGQYTLRGYSVQDFYLGPEQPLTWYETNFAAPVATITIK